MKCVICKDVIRPEWHGWKGGHNAEPVATGRCCSICNWTVVIPTRLNDMGATHAEKVTTKFMKEDKNGKNDKSAT
jgi:hypothetical protein